MRNVLYHMAVYTGKMQAWLDIEPLQPNISVTVPVIGRKCQQTTYRKPHTAEREIT